MKHGNWTVERDEDLTAPYGFNDKMWMAFDDATRFIFLNIRLNLFYNYSLKIVLLKRIFMYVKYIYCAKKSQ